MEKYKFVGLDVHKATIAPPTFHSKISSALPSCVGASNGTTRSSRMRSAWTTSKAEAGEVSTTTQAYVSPPTPSSLPSVLGFPPLALAPSSASKNLPYPKVHDGEEIPLRVERHQPNSFVSTRTRLQEAILVRLERCPCCRRTGGVPVIARLWTQVEHVRYKL